MKRKKSRFTIITGTTAVEKGNTRKVHKMTSLNKPIEVLQQSSGWPVIIFIDSIGSYVVMYRRGNDVPTKSKSAACGLGKQCAVQVN